MEGSLSTNELTIGVSEVRRISRAVQESYGFDFSNYALSSFRRRLERFMRLQKITSVSVLIERMIKDPVFFNFFLKEITVNVTEMFRDSSFWREMRDKLLPELNKRYRIKIWHAGCSSGEEVYTMLIMLSEAGMLDKVRITATDINSDVLKVAQSGLIDAKKMELNQKNYSSFLGNSSLTHYFKREDNTMRIDPRLLRPVTFQEHDLAREGSIGGFDLVLCRNVMIYFNKDLQNRVLSTFSSSLARGSYLAIGTMESLDGTLVKAQFAKGNFRENIYRKTSQ
ncbi:MAG: CheR family methyltransferase [Salibacteraceae bacterium]|mgnify:CR=1 FL=1